MRPRILVLGLEREAGPACLAQAASRDVDVIAADLEEKLGELARFAGSLPVAETCVMDYRDVAASVSIAQELHARRPLDGVFSYREFGLEAAAAIAEALQRPGNPVEVVKLTRDKGRLKRCFAAAGLLQPPSFWCQDPEEALSAFRSVQRQRWILKPRSLSGSLGVQLVDDEESVLRAASTIAALGERQGMLLEGFIEGPELSVEGMVHDGRAHIFALTEKSLFDGPGFVEREHVIPALVSGADEVAIRAAVSRALEVAGVRQGHFHVEVFLTDRGVVVGEVHTRVGGDWIDLLVEETLETELYGLAFDQLLGRPLALDSLRPIHAAGARFLRASPGIVRSVAGIQSALDVEGVVRVDVDLTPGTEIPVLRSSYDRAGSFVVRGTNRSEVRRRLDEVEGLIHVEVAQPSTGPSCPRSSTCE